MRNHSNIDYAKPQFNDILTTLVIPLSSNAARI